MMRKTLCAAVSSTLPLHSLAQQMREETPFYLSFNISTTTPEAEINLSNVSNTFARSLDFTRGVTSVSRSWTWTVTTYNLTNLTIPLWQGETNDTNHPIITGYDEDSNVAYTTWSFGWPEPMPRPTINDAVSEAVRPSSGDSAFDVEASSSCIFLFDSDIPQNTSDAWDSSSSDCTSAFGEDCVSAISNSMASVTENCQSSDIRINQEARNACAGRFGYGAYLGRGKSF